MDLTARNDQIVSLAKSGFNGAEIARMYGLTRAAIGQILRRFGASKSPRKVQALHVMAKMHMADTRTLTWDE